MASECDRDGARPFPALTEQSMFDRDGTAPHPGRGLSTGTGPRPIPVPNRPISKPQTVIHGAGYTRDMSVRWAKLCKKKMATF
jgi:hypothetical protein